MSAVPLRANPPAVPGYRLVRSGLRWLCADGQRVGANEPVAYCSIGIVAAGGGAVPFAEEGPDLQVAFAPPMAGILRQAVGVSHGGYLDRLNNLAWDAPLTLGRIEDPAGETSPEARLLMLAGRRFGEIAGDRSGPLTGWHDRARAWWGEGERHATLIGLGTCEQATLLRGDRGWFAEMFACAAGPVQLIAGADEPLVPCARTLAEQLRFTDADRAAIGADMATGLLAGPHVPTPGDWLFAGALLNLLTRSPLTETPDLLTARGLVQAAPPDAIALSLTAELPQAGRHRRLGYTLNCHGYRLARVGPAVRHWLRTAFEPLPRDADTILADYRDLLALLRPRGTRLFVHNSVSSQSYEQIQSYAALDAASFAGLGSLRAKTLNLMLHDLVREDAALRIVDVDAIVADLGMAAHLPDGVHPSGALQAEIRAEFVRVVAAAGMAGFAARPEAYHRSG